MSGRLRQESQVRGIYADQSRRLRPKQSADVLADVGGEKSHPVVLLCYGDKKEADRKVIIGPARTAARTVPVCRLCFARSRVKAPRHGLVGNA